ncbi:ABC transporter substrate-binding protein [Arthrobacter alkaliphilus]|uniref:ABC transporter substrate-binding protein n=1 Tax=Arthrobacter alkaliphilus TaxID=369936 RepID=UPI001F26BA24|nr:ABC transporter substrate-binding protein [Arthrobacter alkaliphilus]
MTPKRRVWTKALAALVAGALLSLTACSSGQSGSAPTASSSPTQQQVTDVLGRTVTVPAPAKRVLLDGGRMLYTTALLNKKDPLAGIVGMPKDLEQNDPDTLAQYRKQFPDIDKIPRTGQVYDGSFSAETAIKLNPDIFVISAANYQIAVDAGVIKTLEGAGIPTVVVDYFVDPLKNTLPSVQLMGKVLGHTAEAEAFTKKYQSVVDMVSERLKKSGQPATPTLLWRAPGYFDCCSSFAKSNLGQLVTFAGGTNIADDILTTKQGMLSPEAVIKKNPQVIIATGANWAPGTPAKPGSFIPFGYQESPEHAKDQLSAIVGKQTGFDSISAVQNHRAYAVWHHFYDSPYNYLAIAWFAKWMHPDLFADVDPTAMIKELHSSFLPVPYNGTFWTNS